MVPPVRMGLRIEHHLQVTDVLRLAPLQIRVGERVKVLCLP